MFLISGDEEEEKKEEEEEEENKATKPSRYIGATTRL